MSESIEQPLVVTDVDREAQSVTLTMIRPSIVEEDGALVPRLYLAPWAAREVAEALLYFAAQIENRQD